MKKKRIRIAIILTTIVVIAFLSILIYTGVISFLFNGFDYIDSNEEQYVITSTILSKDTKVNLSINESIDIDGIKFSIVAFEKDETSLNFTILIKNNIHYSYGKVLSQKYPFDNYTEFDAQKSGQVFLEFDNQSYKCERKFITYGKNTIKYIYSLKFDKIQIPEINNASIRISDFYLTEYKKR